MINVDGFFERSETPPVKTILHDPEARRRYELKRLWQRFQNRFAKPPQNLQDKARLVPFTRDGANPPRDWEPNTSFL